MGFSIIATGGGQSTNSTTVTTAAVNCTGANLIILAVAFSVSSTGTIADSQGNTYVLQATHGANDSKVTIYTCFGPSVSGSMTFSFTTTSGTAFPAIAVLAVSGAASGTLDQQTGADSFPFTATSTTVGPITPTQNDELWVSAICLESPPGVPANGTGTLAHSAANTSGLNWGLAMAYGVQTTATAQSCGWSWSGASINQTVIASFPASATVVSAQGLCITAGYAIGIIQGTAQGRSLAAGHTAASIQAIAAGLCRTAGHSGGSAIVTNAQGRSYAAGHCLLDPPAVAANGLCRTAGYVKVASILVGAQGRTVCQGHAFGAPSTIFVSGLCRTAGYTPAVAIEGTAHGHVFCAGYTATTPAIVALAQGRCRAAGYVSGTASIKASAQGHCYAAGYVPLLNGAAETCLEGPIEPKPFVAGISGNVSY